MINIKDILDKEKQKIMIPPEMDRKSYVEGAVDTLNRLEPIVEKLVERARQEGRDEVVNVMTEKVVEWYDKPTTIASKHMIDDLLTALTKARNPK